MARGSTNSPPSTTSLRSPMRFRKWPWSRSWPRPAECTNLVCYMRRDRPFQSGSSEIVHERGRHASSWTSPNRGPSPELASARRGQTQRSPLLMKKRRPCFVGIDVSEEQLDLACWPEPTRWRVAHDSAGITPCLAQLRQLTPALLVLEATGGWPYALVAAIAVTQLPFAVVNPRQVRDFAKATGPLAKTEARDAGVMAHVAAAVRPTPRPLPEETTQQLDALLQRRRQRLAR